MKYQCARLFGSGTEVSPENNLAALPDSAHFARGAAPVELSGVEAKRLVGILGRRDQKHPSASGTNEDITALPERSEQLVLESAARVRVDEARFIQDPSIDIGLIQLAERSSKKSIRRF